MYLPRQSLLIVNQAGHANQILDITTNQCLRLSFGHLEIMSVKMNIRSGVQLCPPCSMVFSFSFSSYKPFSDGPVWLCKVNFRYYDSPMSGSAICKSTNYVSKKKHRDLVFVCVYLVQPFFPFLFLCMKQN